ncbi:MAG: excinuclease ABC subunit UvrC [Bacteroidetes bacterium]|nr:excinuclease ABC subunit UvrC [Bacteroidota bacterium]
MDSELSSNNRKTLPYQSKLQVLPQKPGVYRFLNREGTVIYVGKAQNLRARVKQYFQSTRSQEPRIAVMASKIYDLEVTVTDTEVEALILEANLIKELKPRYNVVLKDDKSYPYIAITHEEYPRVLVTRKRIAGGADYFGPYTEVRSMRSALKTIRSLFMIRSCNYDLNDETIAKRKYKVCLDYHIKKCGGPCEGLVSKTEYQRMIVQVANVLNGKTKDVRRYLETEMNKRAEELKYEEAALYRDKIQQLHVYEEKQKIIDPKERDRDIFGVYSEQDSACCVLFRAREGKIIGNRNFLIQNVQSHEIEDILEQVLEQYYLENNDIPETILVPERLDSQSLIEEWLRQMVGNAKVSLTYPQNENDKQLLELVKTNAQYVLKEYLLQKSQATDYIPVTLTTLQQELHLQELPRRIECFDISTFQGSDTVASMVVFVDGKPKKSEYRKYHIQTVKGQDDFASIREVIERRYSKISFEEKPNLIVIDGGKGQLSSAQEVLTRYQVHIPVIGLAKRLEEIFIPNVDEPILLPKTSPSLRLLQRIRNEAHRFAVEYHRVVRTKRVLRTELDLIKGVGKKRAKELLEIFGSVQAIRFANEEQLAEIVGPKVAEQIREYFDTSSNGL